MWIPIIGIAAALLYVVAVWVIWRAGPNHEDWMPFELKGARLLYAEPRPLYIYWPERMVAKPDRAYEMENAAIRLVEFKTRKMHAVFDSDVIELSAQRLVLNQHHQQRVENVGYVVTQNAGGDRRTHRVRLFNERDTLKLVRRYRQLVGAIIDGTMANQKNKCTVCAYSRECRPPVLRGAGPEDR